MGPTKIPCRYEDLKAAFMTGILEDMFFGKPLLVSRDFEHLEEKKIIHGLQHFKTGVVSNCVF